MTTSTRKILALLPNWLGDVAMCTPALRALHRRFPDAELSVAGRKAACELVHGLPWLSSILPLPARPTAKNLLLLGAQFRPYARDLTVIFPHSFRAAMLARAAGSKRRVGYARDGRSILLTDAVPPYRENGRIRPIYMAKEYLDLLTPLGCEDDGMGLDLHADPAAVNDAKQHLEGDGPIVGFAPGGAFGGSKRWPPERFATVADGLTERLGARCVLLTGPGEETIRDAVLSAAKTTFIQCDEGKPSVKTLKASISLLDLLVCNDSGPRHVAVAFHVPTVCVMGSTSPRYSEGPYERGQVVRVDVDCGPCQKPTCETDHRCMTQITPSIVTQAALDVFAKTR